MCPAPLRLAHVRLTFFLLLAFLSGGVPASGQPEPESRSTPRPNIIVIVSDDHRADVLGCAGHPVVRTPHLDDLAGRGTRFENAFVTTSICAASRATILTGLTERAHGYTFGTPPLAADLCAESYPARLRQSGYRTGFVGKLGVGVEGGRRTIDAMFDSFAPLHRTPYVKTLADGTTRHLTDITGDEAIAFLRETPPDTPFCLSVSFNAGHAEDGDLDNHYPPPPAEAELYADIRMPRPRLDDPAIFDAQPDFLKNSLNRLRYHWRWDTPEKYDHNLRNYYRMITGLDRNIGRILAEAQARTDTGRTVVIFLGDNGYYMGERGFAGKWSHYDESLRIPLIIADPRAPSPARGRRAPQAALNLDIAPTVLELAGLEPNARIGGHSLLPALHTGTTPSGRDGFLCEHLMRHPAIPRWVGFRTDRFKYARYIDQPYPNEFLHDLEQDPHELTNLAADPAHAEELANLRAAAATQARQHADADRLSRVLLLGDSISIGYHDAVVEELAGEAVVFRPPENCAGTTKGVQRIDTWLAIDGGGFDIIHFNFGLHDLKRVKPDGANSNDPSHPRQAEPDTYAANLETIVGRLSETDATLIFATTTPFPTGVRPHRTPADADRYNEIAAAVMAAHGVAINDLNAFAAPMLEDLQQPVNVHFTARGSRVLASEVARSIRRAILQPGE